MAKTEKQHNLVAMFKALGDPMRLRVFLYLRSHISSTALTGESGSLPEGPTVTEVSRNVAGSKKIPSKVSRALKELRVAGLVSLERQGKNILCGVNKDAMAALESCFGTVDDDDAARPMAAGPNLALEVTPVEVGETATAPSVRAGRKAPSEAAKSKSRRASGNARPWPRVREM